MDKLVKETIEKLNKKNTEPREITVKFDEKVSKIILKRTKGKMSHRDVASILVTHADQVLPEADGEQVNVEKKESTEQPDKKVS